MRGVGTPLTKLFDSSALPGPVLDSRISADGSLVGFVCEKELYTCAIAAGGDGMSAPKQLTTSARGTARTNGLADFIAMEEMDRMEGYWISTDGKYVCFEQSDESHIPQYRICHQGQDDPATQEDHHYPFAGAPNPKVRLGVAEVASGKVGFLDISATFGGTDDLYLARVQWAGAGTKLLVQMMNRGQSELSLLQFDAAAALGCDDGDAEAAGVELVREVRDGAWINLHDILVPLQDGGFLWASERTGYMHLYRYDGSVPAQCTAVLTEGECGHGRVCHLKTTAMTAGLLCKFLRNGRQRLSTTV
jgi:dipeptidyl-peptidase-4